MTADRKKPWHKRYHSDALTGFRGLTLEQRGAYQTILDLLYDSEAEALTASERWMAGQMDVSVRRWRIIRDELVDLGKITVLEDGRITNDRYLRERAKDAALSAKRAEAGSKGGRAGRDDDLQGQFDEFSTPENPSKTDRKFLENSSSGEDNSDEQSGKSNDINEGGEASASDLPPLRAREPDTRVQRLDNNRTPTSSLETREAGRPDRWAKGSAPEVAIELCRLAGVPNVQTAAISRNEEVVRNWMEQGVDMEEAARIIREVVVENARTRTPVFALRYFDARVLQTAAARNAGAAPAKPMKAKPPMDVKDDKDDRVAAIRVALRDRLGPQTFEAWAGRHIALHINGVGLVVEARSPFAAEQLRTNHVEDFLAAARRHGVEGVKFKP